MTIYIGVYGASGFGKEVMPLVRQQYPTLLQAQFVFIDDGQAGSTLNGYPVLSYADFVSHSAQHKAVTIAIANSRVREKIAQRLEADGIQLWSITADHVVLMDQIELAECSALSPFVSIGSNVKIGKCFHANLYSYVEHDCVIGDYVTFAPGVKCNGNIHIEDHAYIGAGAVIKQGTPAQPLVIGHGAEVGMGAVVTKSVPAGVTVAGIPPRILTSK